MFIGLLIAAVYVLITVKSVVEYGDTSTLFFALLFPGIGFTALFAFVFGKTKIQLKIFGLVWGLGFGGMPWVMMALPYTYVLGVSDEWIKKFEVIALQPPDWYAGSTAFNMVAFASFMNATMATASTAMSSSPSSSGGSGGGSSGGGSGGGGGSW